MESGSCAIEGRSSKMRSSSTSASALAHSYSPSSSSGTTDAWLEIDLVETSFVSSISVYNRADPSANRLSTFVVALSDTPQTVSERAACSTHTASTDQASLESNRASCLAQLTRPCYQACWRRISGVRHQLTPRSSHDAALFIVRDGL